MSRDLKRKIVADDSVFVRPTTPTSEKQYAGAYAAKINAAYNDSAIIDSVSGKTIIESTKEICGVGVQFPFSQSQISTTLVVSPIRPETDGPYPEKLLALDTVNKKCETMKISTLFGDFGFQVLSPDGKSLAAVFENAPRTLYLLDLTNDTSKKIVNLPESETLNGGFGALSNVFELSWANASTIQYSVYRNIPYDEQNTNSVSKPLIERRTVNIN